MYNTGELFGSLPLKEIMPVYSVGELCEMVLIFGECQRNSHAAARLYAERFPMGKHPSHMTIRNLVSRFRATGTVKARPRSGRPHRDDTAIVSYVQSHPHCSSREVSEMSGVSQRMVLRILHRHGFHPYHVHPQHSLHVGDDAQRLEWCNFVMNQLEEDPAFLSNILWTDESKFSRDGIVNRHNLHYWDVSNPHWTRDDHHQIQWSTNVWCGIWSDCIVGPVFYEGALNGERYLHILHTDVTDWLENVPLHHLRSMWYQHDGAPPHRARGNYRWLTHTFEERWIGNGGPVSWPPRSPDLTPLDFFLWGYLKSKVYATPPPTLQDLKQRIIAACRSVDVDMLKAIPAEVQKRVQTCIAAEGRTFEYNQHK